RIPLTFTSSHLCKLQITATHSQLLQPIAQHGRRNARHSVLLHSHHPGFHAAHSNHPLRRSQPPQHGPRRPSPPHHHQPGQRNGKHHGRGQESEEGHRGDPPRQAGHCLHRLHPQGVWQGPRHVWRGSGPGGGVHTSLFGWHRSTRQDCGVLSGWRVSCRAEDGVWWWEDSGLGHRW
ncbi:hypothetical protein N658DRAFT_562728, partial [Parathielavia hyrcaniae]